MTLLNTGTTIEVPSSTPCDAIGAINRMLLGFSIVPIFQGRRMKQAFPAQ